MKKFASILAVVLFSMGLLSCEAESTAEDQILYEIGTDGDDNPNESRDSTDGDDNPNESRDSTDGDDNPNESRGGN